MKKLNLLLTLLTCTVLASGCATQPEIYAAENEPLCWGNIMAKSDKTELPHIFLSGGVGLTIEAGILAWNTTSKILHGVAATVNPNCHYNASDSNSSDTSEQLIE